MIFDIQHIKVYVVFACLVCLHLRENAKHNHGYAVSRRGRDVSIRVQEPHNVDCAPFSQHRAMLFPSSNRIGSVQEQHDRDLAVVFRPCVILACFAVIYFLCRPKYFCDFYILTVGDF